MNRVVFILAALFIAGISTSLLANPVPVTNTTKNPYRAAKSYCNDASGRTPKGENISCYNHDACYSDPRGRSRGDCDKGYLRDMRRAGFDAIGLLKYRALRYWGEAAWKRAREHDKRQAAQ